MSASHLLHALWTKAVGTPDYNERQWIALERIVMAAERVAEDVHTLDANHAAGDCDSCRAPRDLEKLKKAVGAP